MIQLEIALDARRAIQLGQIADLRITRSDPEIEVRVYLQHRPILYTEPIQDWSLEPSLLIFPEAPGQYTVHAHWRSSDGEHGGEQGVETFDFSVVVGESVLPEPAKFPLNSGSEIWVPNAWEANGLRGSEKETASILGAAIQAGMAVYDLGANIGFYTSIMSRLAGPEGHVYCVEANPNCVQFLRTNILLQDLENVDILPVAVLDQDGRTRFCLNYGNSNLGLSEASGFFGAKAGHVVWVPCFAFDHLVEHFKLRPPDFVKVDVEGVEHLVVQGMEKTLQEHHPVLLLELHGEAPAAKTLEVLDRFDYRYIDPVSEQELTPVEAVNRVGGRVYNLLARPRTGGAQWTQGE